MRQHDVSILQAEAAKDSTYVLVEKVSEQLRNQARVYAIYSIVTVILGILLIFSGVVIVFFVHNVVSGLIAILGGIIPQIVANFFLKSSKDLNLQEREMVQKLVDIDRSYQAFQIASTLETGEARDRIIEKVISQLITPEASKTSLNVPSPESESLTKQEGDTV